MLQLCLAGSMPAEKGVESLTLSNIKVGIVLVGEVSLESPDGGHLVLDELRGHGGEVLPHVGRRVQRHGQQPAQLLRQLQSEPKYIVINVSHCEHKYF